MIELRTHVNGLTPDQVQGFFVGWPNPPSPLNLLKILKQSAHVVVAIDAETGHMVGFVNAISDGIMSAYLPLLEVLPEYQHRGLGSELVRRMLDELKNYYMIDLSCDDGLVPFYQQFKMTRSNAMMLRNHHRQNCD